MNTKDLAVVGLNVVIVAALAVLVFLRVITWQTLMQIASGLVVPSGVAAAARLWASRKGPPPPPAVEDRPTEPRLPAPPPLPKNVKRFSPRATLLPAAVVLALLDCTPASSPTGDADVVQIVETGVGAANGVCSLIEGLTSSGTVETICATVDEIASIVGLILTLRGTSAPPATCAPLPTSALCASKREIGQGIEFLVRARAARLILDGGK